jgi:hypothetical protein
MLIVLPRHKVSNAKKHETGNPVPQCRDNPSLNNVTVPTILWLSS